MIPSYISIGCMMLLCQFGVISCGFELRLVLGCLSLLQMQCGFFAHVLTMFGEERALAKCEQGAPFSIRSRTGSALVLRVLAALAWLSSLPR